MHYMFSDLPTSRHPFELFMLALCVVSGLPMLLGEPRPGSMSAVLPTWAVMGWGFTLTFGAIIALIGVAWSRRITGIILEQIGLAWVGVSACIYGIIIYLVVGQPSSVTVGITIGFGAACIWRWWQLQRYLRRITDQTGPIR